jgi:hypothetical protein
MGTPTNYSVNRWEIYFKKAFHGYFLYLTTSHDQVLYSNPECKPRGILMPWHCIEKTWEITQGYIYIYQMTRDLKESPCPVSGSMCSNVSSLHEEHKMNPPWRCHMSYIYMYLLKKCLKNSYNLDRVRVTLRLAVYLQSIRLGDKPFETHDEQFYFPTEH